MAYIVSNGWKTDESWLCGCINGRGKSSLLLQKVKTDLEAHPFFGSEREESIWPELNYRGGEVNPF